MIKEHPFLFVILFTVCIASELLHVVYAIEYAKKRERSFFEGLALTCFMLVAWPLFSFGMMCRGYMDFYKKTWGKKTSWGADVP